MLFVVRLKNGFIFNYKKMPLFYMKKLVCILVFNLSYGHVTMNLRGMLSQFTSILSGYIMNKLYAVLIKQNHIIVLEIWGKINTLNPKQI